MILHHMLFISFSLQEESVLSTLMSFGIRSGKTGHLAMEVDGLTFHPTHSDIITRLREVTLGSTPLTELK